MHGMIVHDRYRNGVGIVLVDQTNQVLVARRPEFTQTWQFPQGGIDTDEDAETAAYREMREEIGVRRELVKLLGNTNGYFSYRYPGFVTSDAMFKKQNYDGQRLQFFLFRFYGEDADIDVTGVLQPEFDSWMWVDFWRPIQLVVEFKKKMYESALRELQELFEGGQVYC